MPVDMLMALAGFQCAVLARQLLLETSAAGAAVLVGKGNNGGDALVCARHLQDWGIQTRVLLVAAELGGAPGGLAGAAKAAGAELVPIEANASPESTAGEVLKAAGVVVDGLLGTGVTGAPREPVAGVIRRLNRSSATVLAIDLPSGLDADQGTVVGECVRAHHTLMLGAAKAGCLRPSARHWVGRLWLADIGIPKEAYASAGLVRSPDLGPQPSPFRQPG